MVSLKGHRPYLDANTVIYALEGLPQYVILRTGLLDPLDAGEFVAVTSQLTLLEALVFPRRNADLAAEQTFRAFLAPSGKLAVEAISLAVLEKAIDLRARFSSLKTPDAIHIATGLLAGCDLFVTRDAGWAKTGTTVVSPMDVA